MGNKQEQSSKETGNWAAAARIVAAALSHAGLRGRRDGGGGLRGGRLAGVSGSDALALEQAFEQAKVV